MKKALIAQVVRLIVGVGFAATIMLSYFQHHTAYTDAVFKNKGVLLPVLLAGMFLIAGWSFANYVNKNDEEVSRDVRPYSLWLWAMLFISVIVVIYYAVSPFTASFIGQLTQKSAVYLNWTGALWSFWSYAFPIFLFLTGLSLVVAGIGYRVFGLLNWEFESRLERMVLGVALGLTLLITLLAGIGLVGLFNLPVVGILGLVSVVFTWSAWKSVVNDFLWEEVTISFSYRKMNWVWCLILFTIIGFNIIDLIRPFPIGWDDLGVYMNFPRQIAMKGALLKGYTGQAYMLITSLGYLVANSATWAMFLAWWGGILSLWAVYLLGKKFVSSEAGIVMAAIMYGLPMIMHQSFADMKLDPPLFFFIVIGFYTVFRALQLHSEGEKSVQWLAFAGILWGMALAVKITTALALFPILIVLAWRYGSKWWALAVGFLLHALYFYQFVTVSDIPATGRFWIVWISIAIALVFTIIALIKRQAYWPWLRASAYLIIGMFVIWLPWTFKVISDTPVLSISSFISTIFYGGQSPAPQIAWNKIGIEPSVCTYTGGTEELGRYIGNEPNLLQKYTSVFWDLTMNINQAGFYVDISFLFLGLIPLLLLFWRKVDWPHFWQNIVLCFCLIWYFWLFVASGVPWYGLAGFLPGLLLIVRVKELAQKQMWFGQYIIPLLIIISLISTSFLRESKFANTGQMAYAFGIMSAQDVLRSTNQSYPAIIAALNSDAPTTTSPHYIYRVGTFINYFIDNNRERVYDDAQLDTFRCIDGDGTDDVRTLNRLRTLGFHYMIYDTNTETIEQNTQGTLHRKTNRFKQFAFKNLKVIAPKDQAQYRNGIILFEIAL